MFLTPWSITIWPAGVAGAGRNLPAVEAERIAQVAKSVPDRPLHFTPNFDDRSYWSSLSSLPAANTVLYTARKAARTPIPQLPDSLYGEFKKSGNRSSYETAANLRTERLVAFVIIEGIENKGQWLPQIEAEIAAILEEPTWVVPAHVDRVRRTRAQARDYIDLAAAARALTLATTDYLLADRLQPQTRARIREEVNARVLAPWLERMRSGNRKDFWWMNVENNWSAVCNTGVLGAALLLVDSPQERAEFIAGYEALMPIFLNGFTDDGFCLEGIGYWTYGFGHYVVGSELIRLNTNGAVDLLSAPKVGQIASFARDWEIANLLLPTFGDAWIGGRVPSWLAPFIASRFEAPAATDNVLRLQHKHTLGSQLYSILFGLAHRPPENPDQPRNLPPYSWFPYGGALVARSQPADRGLSVALKGGDNGQPHNHNDLGSFIVACDGVLIMADLGADEYVKDTFGPLRYNSDMMNSRGHPVPLVAGQLQKTGAEAEAVTVRTEFTDEGNVWEMDLTSAYDVAELEKLTRTFIFSREEGGRLEVVDRVRFSSPQDFGTAVILLPEQQRQSVADGSFRIQSGDSAVNVAFTAKGGELMVAETPVRGIVAGGPAKGTRVGLDFGEPVREAEIRLVITPVASASQR